MAKAVKSKVRRGVKAVKTTPKKAASKKVAKTTAKAAVAVNKVTAKAVAASKVAEESKKKLSEKLLATIEKRKAEQAAKKPAFSKPRGRRGRRPKNLLEYQPYSEDQQDDPYAENNENENLEYDTGIRVTSTSSFSGSYLREDGSVVMERVEDFDEELNFDW